MVDLYRGAGLDVYEAAHYSRGEAAMEVEAILSWFPAKEARVLDLGCSGGLHALEFARRGFRVTGVDLERSAIERARKRSSLEPNPATFLTLDLSKEPLTPLGSFDLVYSIGNVLSHPPKALIGDLFGQIALLLNEGGALLFDLLVADPRLPGACLEESTNILWKRQLEESTGRMHLEGDFLDFGITQSFDVWGYAVHEVETLLHASGFTSTAISTTLAFDRPHNPDRPTASLKFRTKRGN